MHPSIAISTDIPRIAGLLGSARRTTTKFDAADRLTAKMTRRLASQGRNSPLCPEIKAHFCRRRPPHLTDLSVMPARGDREPAMALSS
jgi:hypothetical protein